MPGQLCAGQDHKNAIVKNSKAYCEGRRAKADGGSVGNNPHIAASDAGVSWVSGFNSSEAGCCAS